ncbi:predicted protein [Plenodomus lingam JN3]|uniref:Predicted protein n=1 Tax=Leptosphaeria maculans (strain JN3 / isolate v23.1.3 / race Av1-4-5-6-7-8) TaxID=985895 RepID=E5A8M0_LEPMJ|nr:predicted protein [Plenodomus lingam JN3]CBX99965.1 predicted protein [Plenodomus lingam JN3]
MASWCVPHVRNTIWQTCNSTATWPNPRLGSALSPGPRSPPFWGPSQAAHSQSKEAWFDDLRAGQWRMKMKMRLTS